MIAIPVWAIAVAYLLILSLATYAAWLYGWRQGALREMRKRKGKGDE